MRILLVNSDVSLRADLFAALTGNGVSIREGTDRPTIHNLLLSSTEPVVVIINFTISDWMNITSLLKGIADTPALSTGHAFILLLSTRDTIPISLGHVIARLPVYFSAKPINVSVLRRAVLTAYRRDSTRQTGTTITFDRPTGSFEPS